MVDTGLGNIVLGTITDYHGNTLETVRAPASGLLLIVFGTPPVNQGENLAVVGLIPQSSD